MNRLRCVLFVLINGRAGSWTALVLWFVLCASDGVDGWIARRQGVTISGAFLDPLADKILVLGAMFTLVSEHVLWIVPVAIIATHYAQPFQPKHFLSQFIAFSAVRQ